MAPGGAPRIPAMLLVKVDKLHSRESEVAWEKGARGIQVSTRETKTGVIQILPQPCS